MDWQPLQAISCVLILLHHPMSVNTASTERQQSINTTSTDCQQSVNDIGYYILCNPRTMLWQITIIIILAAVLSKSDRNMVTTHSENEHQQSVNNFVCCTLYNPKPVLRHLCIIEVLPGLIDNIVCVDTVAPENERQQSVNGTSTEHQHSVNRVSTECQRCWVLHHV
jgi:hypothetical protein